MCCAPNRCVTGRMTDGTGWRAACHVPSNHDGERLSSSHPSQSRSVLSDQSKVPVFRCNISPEVFTR
uniref:Uncharacterized protein n=1 Tax=Oryza barthii TaxID=65489 RepID=A0A0D3GV38_9ORYZ